MEGGGAENGGNCRHAARLCPRGSAISPADLSKGKTSLICPYWKLVGHCSILWARAEVGTVLLPLPEWFHLVKSFTNGRPVLPMLVPGIFKK